MNKLIDMNIDKNVATITLNNPPVNALSCNMISLLIETLADLNSNDNVKTIIITGAGRTFCAGADIKELTTINTCSDGESFSKKGNELMDIIEFLNIPVIAAINGACLGAGNELAMACHIRFASDDAWFAQPEINLGIIPGFGGISRLRRITGRGITTELLLTGKKISAKEALNIGLINMVFPKKMLIEETKELARIISSKSKIAISLCLKAIQRTEDESKLFGKSFESSDKVEGMNAFFEKRQASFKDK